MPYISKAELLKQMEELIVYPSGYYVKAQEVLDLIRNFPEAKIETPKTGRWIRARCSNCGHVDIEESAYCGKCGSKNAEE